MRSSKTWLVTDTHFFDDQMIELGRPPLFTTIIWGHLRYYVAKQDILIHLGDVIDDKEKSFLKLILDSIVCKTKVLVRGNHDKQTNNWYLNNGFDLVVDSLAMKNVILSHKPLPPPFPPNIMNIHGHLHNFGLEHDKECQPYYDGAFHRLFALEYTDYKPVVLEEFI